MFKLFGYTLLALTAALSAQAFAVVEFVPTATGQAQSAEQGGGSGCGVVVACSEWGACVDGVQVRSCNVTRSCGQPMPVVNQSCTLPESEISLDAFTGAVVDDLNESIGTNVSDSHSVALPIFASKKSSFMPVLMVIILVDVLLLGLVVRSYSRKVRL